MIPKAFRQKRKQTQLQVRIWEDLPERVSKPRTALYQLMKYCIYIDIEILIRENLHSLSPKSSLWMGRIMWTLSRKKQRYKLSMYPNRMPTKAKNEKNENLILTFVPYIYKDSRNMIQIVCWYRFVINLLNLISMGYRQTWFLYLLIYPQNDLSYMKVDIVTR